MSLQNRGLIWSYAVAMAFFAISLSIFLPLSAALAGNASSLHPVLAEICGIGGTQLVSLASTDTDRTQKIAHGHEYCSFCSINFEGKFFVSAETSLPEPALVSARLGFPPTKTVIQLSLKTHYLVRAPPVLL